MTPAYVYDVLNMLIAILKKVYKRVIYLFKNQFVYDNQYHLVKNI